MKRFLVALAFGLMAVAAQAEASFDQVETLIQQKQYQVAILALEEIVHNHPKSSKAFYAMAQAQAGVGNLPKAQLALDKAQALNPTLDFAPASSVASLRDAITPQTVKIEKVEDSHFWRNFLMGFVLFAGGGLILALYIQKKNKEEEEKELSEKLAAQAEREARYAQQREDARKAREAMEKAEAERVAKIEAAEAALRAHKNYGHERFDPENPDKLKTVKRMKDEAAEKQRLFLEAEAKRERARAEAAEDDARRARMHYSSPAPTTTVVNNGSSSTDLLTGMMIGNMMSGGHHHDTHHDTTVIRETVREVPAPSRDSSWDDAPAKSSSRSSSWDDDSSSSSSSSWSSSSSSDSSSSWSSSSDSSSSSSWD